MTSVMDRIVNHHVRQDHFAGPGHGVPREFWVDCSCGAMIYQWQQFYHENEEDPDELWVRHVAAKTLLYISDLRAG